MKKPVCNQRGMALLLVLVVVALLSALLTELAFSTLVDLRLAETFRDSTRAAYLAKGGIRVGRIILQEDGQNISSRDFDHPSELWGLGVVSQYPVGDGFLTISVEDLEGKLNLKRLVIGTGSSEQADVIVKERFNSLFTELNFPDPEELTAALIDWIDSNSDVYDGYSNVGVVGAEDNYYLNQKKTYKCKNAPLDSLDELVMVRGFTPEMVEILDKYIAVSGGATLNLNTATPEVMSVWDVKVTPQNIETILKARDIMPIKSRKELLDLIQNSYAPSDFAFKSDTFRIKSWGDVNSGTRNMEAIVRKSGQLLYLKVK